MTNKKLYKKTEPQRSAENDPATGNKGIPNR